MRLDRLLAEAGCGSRSEMKKWIRARRVQVDGRIAEDAGLNLDPEAAPDVLVDGLPVLLRQHLTIIMHKPAGLITALDDLRHATIADCLPAHWMNRGLVPVGRLDRDTTGLLILTTDGMLCHRLASPRWSVGKTYRVTVSGPPLTEQDVRAFAAGLVLPDGLVCRPAVLALIDPLTADLEIHEGKYHQVKRMMLAGGRTVLALHRWKIGPIELDPDLQPGQVRFLTQNEIDRLYQSVNLD